MAGSRGWDPSQDQHMDEQVPHRLQRRLAGVRGLAGKRSETREGMEGQGERRELGSC